MNLLDRIAEERLAEAVRRGDFDALPLAGKPLPPDLAADVPQELRASYRILKQAGCLPPELEQRRELLRLEDLLAVARETERGSAGCEDLERRLRSARLRYELLRERGRPTGAFLEYESNVLGRLAGGGAS